MSESKTDSKTDAKVKTAAELAEERARAAGAEAPKTDAPKSDTVTLPVSELEALKAKAAERDAFHEKYLRSLAEFDNYQKRARREQASYREEAVRDLLGELLLVLDNIDLAYNNIEPKLKDGGKDLETLGRGVALVRDQILTLLANRKATQIEVKPGQAFDTNVHEAVSMQEAPGLAKDEVMAIVRRGFNLGTTLLRPAQVVVKKAVAASSS